MRAETDYRPGHKPTHWHEAESVAPARFEGGRAVRDCPECGMKVTEGYPGYRGTNFLGHRGSLTCERRRAAK